MIEEAVLMKRKLFRKLIAHKTTVFRICLGFSKNPWEAEELTQDVYVKAYESFDSLKNSRSSKTWLFKIAKNTCLDYRKKRSKNAFIRVDEESEPVDCMTPESRVVLKEQIQMLKNAVQALPKKQKEVFILREYGHLSYKEIASTLGIRKGTVMSRLNRAREAVILSVKEMNHE